MTDNQFINYEKAFNLALQKMLDLEKKIFTIKKVVLPPDFKFSGESIDCASLQIQLVTEKSISGLRIWFNEHKHFFYEYNKKESKELKLILFELENLKLLPPIEEITNLFPLVTIEIAEALGCG